MKFRFETEGSSILRHCVQQRPPESARGAQTAQSGLAGIEDGLVIRSRTDGAMSEIANSRLTRNQ